MEVLMANKVGRPKAKVSITFREDELKKIINSLAFQVATERSEVEDFVERDDTQALRSLADDMILYAKVLDIYQNKYRVKSASDRVTEAFIKQYSYNVEIESKRRRKQMEGKQ
jgi:hypothetical protein